MILHRHLGRHLANNSADTQPTFGRHSAEISVEYWRHYRPILEQHLGRHSAEISAEYWPTLSADTRVSARVSSYDTIRGAPDDISANTWPTSRPTLRRNLDQVLNDTIGRHSVEISVLTDAIGRNLGRVLTDTFVWHLADTRPTSRPTLSADTQSKSWSSIDQQYRPILDRHLGRHYRPTLGRVLTDTFGRHSAAILADTLPTSRLTLGRDIDRHLVERWLISCSSSWQTVSRHYRSILGWYVGLHSADTSTVTLQWTVGGISVDCLWYIGWHLVVYCIYCHPKFLT